ncbi:ribosome maturation protein RimP, partial [Pseudomonas putida]
MGASPIFYLHSMHEGVQVSSKLEQLQALLAPVVEGLGYQCWGIEYVSQG